MEVVTACPICFEELKEGETASPDICDHTFCLHCLRKWAKREKVCPVDRKRFKKIIDLSTSLPILIKPRKRKKQPELYDVSVHCEVCSKTNNEETLILCDCCDLGFHCKCLTPPLSTVPSGVWHCPLCVAVSEKIRSKKGITKDVELIFKNHINSESCSSESDSSSDKFQNISHSSKESKSKNSNKSLKSQKRSNLERDTLNKGSKSLYESCLSYGKTTSTSNANLCHSRGSRNLLSNEHLEKLRPRQRKPQYTCDDSSSEENSDLEHDKSYFLRKRNFKCSTNTHYTLGESSSSSKENSDLEHNKNYLLRNRNFIYSTNAHNNLEESSNSFEGMFGVEHKASYSLRNKNQNFSKAMNSVSTPQQFKQSKPLDQTLKEKDCKDFNFSFKAKHSIKKTFPEATITSSNVNNTNGLTLSDIVIEHTISLKSANKFNNEKFEETKTDSDCVSDVDKNKEFLEMSRALDDSCTGKPELRSAVGIFSDTNKEFDASLSKNKNNSPYFDNCDINIKSDKCDASHLNSNKQNKHDLPIFSVFEKLEDDNSSEKKYFDISHAVNERGLENSTSKSAPPATLPKITSVKSCCDKKSFYTQETVLSKELLKMQKKKWKTYHLHSEKKCRCNLGQQRCHKHYKNKIIESRQIGHHNKRSEHYSKLLSTIGPFIKKSKWNQLDLVILKNVRKKTGIVYSCDNSSSSPNYNPYIHLNNNQSKELISIKAENILKMKKSEKALLNAVMCLSSTHDLAVRPDGTVFVNWKNPNPLNL